MEREPVDKPIPLRDLMWRAAFGNKQDDHEKLEQIKATSLIRLQKIMETKVRTAFIAALSQFEKHFGALWGHNKPSEARTPEQQEAWDVWQQARTEVLNDGNKQLRAVGAEVVLYDVVFKGYQNTYKGSPGWELTNTKSKEQIK